MSSPRSDTEGRDAREDLADSFAEGLYRTMFDPRCDTEGAVWDDAKAIARKALPIFLRDLFASVGVEGDGVLCLVREGTEVRIEKAS